MKLKAHEKVVMERLLAVGNPLRWKPDHRDEHGNLVLECEAAPEHRKPTTMTITRSGLVYSA